MAEAAKISIPIGREVLAELLAAAAAAPRLEVCGLLLGHGGRIEQARPCANVAPDPAITFEIDPAALLAAHRAARVGGPAVLGCYHSHPSGDATPSATDRAMAAPGALWLIIAGGTARLWRMDQGDAMEAMIVAT